jgi:NitT/TauT family transport system substrate-binding protein
LRVIEGKSVHRLALWGGIFFAVEQRYGLARGEARPQRLMTPRRVNRMSVGVIRASFALIATAALGAVLSLASAHAQIPVKVSLDGRPEGPSAPLLLALDRGYFKDEGLDVTIEPAANPQEPFTRLATGGFDIGVGDINALMRWRDQNPTVPTKAIFVIHNRPAYGILGRKSRGVMAPKDLEEKKLGAPALDPASAAWTIFAKLNDVDVGKVTVLNVAIPVREPMLAAGEVDAITAVSYGSPITLRERGVPADDLTFMLMADYGLQVYGSSILAAPKFLAEKPDAAKGFLRAYTRALKEAIKDPSAAIAALMQRNGGLNRDIELQRLKLVIKAHILTAEVKANGFGEIDAGRFERAIEQIALTYTFKNRPKAADIFDESFLPPEAERAAD